MLSLSNSCARFLTNSLFLLQKFFLGGRLIFGPDARSLLITLLLVIVPVTIFCVFVARHLRHQFSVHNAGYAVIVAAIVFTIHVSLVTTHFTLEYCLMHMIVMFHVHGLYGVIDAY